MLEIKTLLGTWKSVTREEAELFYGFFNKNATSIKSTEKHEYFNKHHIRGGNVMLNGKVETAEEKEMRMFQCYKNDLIKLAETHGKLRFICVEYVCSAPDIDPYEMGASLINDGIAIVYDDSSINTADNKAKKRKVERTLKQLMSQVS